MYLMDCHTHTKFSGDGHSDPSDICRAAVGKGLCEIALTDHFDIGFDPVYWGFEVNLSGMRDSIRLAAMEQRDQIKVRFGIELGGAMRDPALARRVLSDCDFDLVIGSIHSLPKSYDFYYYDYTRIDPNAFFDEYLDCLFELAGTDFYDVLGHLTYPQRYIQRCTGKPFDLTGFEEKLRAILRRVVEKGRGIEINTSGLRQGMGCTMPEIGMAGVFRELGGEYLTVGSDAHYPEDVGAGVEEVTRTLRDMGWRYLASYDKRMPVLRSIG